MIQKMSYISHKPEIDNRSRKIIKELHEKLSDNQIPHYEFLLFKGREYERKAQEQRSESEAKSKSMCTFFPDTSVTSSFYSKVKDKQGDSILRKSIVEQSVILNNKSK